MKLIRSHTFLLVAALMAGIASAEPGVTADTILIGQSAGFTGGQAAYSKDVKVGIESYFNAVNKSGGINGRKLKLVSLDDQGKKDNVVANTKKLVGEENVFALIGYTSGAGVEAALDFVEKAKVPMLSPATGNMGIRAKFHRQLFHTRAGYDVEMKAVVGNMSINGIKRFALVYLDDVGPANPKAMMDAMAEYKLLPVAAVPINRNSEDFSSQAETLVKAQPDAVLMISNSKPIVKLVQEMKKRGYAGRFVTSSFSGTGLIADLKDDAAGITMIQVLPPVTKDILSITKDFAVNLNSLSPETKANYTNFEGYIAARVMVEGLKRAGKTPTRGSFVTGLESIRNLDLGGYTINYSSNNHNGSNFADIGIVRKDGTLRF